MVSDLGAVAGGAVGAVAFAVLIGIAIFCFVKYMRTRKYMTYLRDGDHEKSPVEVPDVPLRRLPPTKESQPKQEKQSLGTSQVRGTDTTTEYSNIVHPETVYVNAVVGTERKDPYAIDVGNFWGDITQRLLDADGLSAEYTSISKELLEPCTISSQSIYKKKCRFKGMVPYDHSRVVLATLPGDETSHFINASYFDGYSAPKTYIAAQGPVAAMVNDFWRMIWETNCDTILMLTNLFEKGQKKCDRYWPESGSDTYGNATVTLLAEDVYPDYVRRTLDVGMEKGTKRREVWQYHFTTWLDHDVPDSTAPLLDYWELVKAEQRQPRGTTIVHCSAGVGRTGTYLAFLYLMDEAKHADRINIHDHVEKMRHQRPNMVQTLLQYTFVYRLIRDGLASASAILSVKENTSLAVSPQTISAQYQSLEKIRRDLTEVTTTGGSPANLGKNRSSQVIAADHSRVKIREPVSGSTDYINAVFVPTYGGRYNTMATHYPLSVTLTDFWAVVSEYKVNKIVAFKDSQLTPYWPGEGETTTQGPFCVVASDDVQGINSTSHNLTIRKEIEEPIRVELIEADTWNMARGNSSSEALSFVQSVLGNDATPPRILVHCLDGVEHSGLFCALLSVVQRLTAEKIVNPFTTVQETRRARKVFINSKVQYEFLFKVIVNMSEQLMTYENL